MQVLQDILRFFGHGFCHQLPTRSFEAGGLVFSACARDTGIYLGFFFALIAALLVYAHSRQKPAELPPLIYLIVLELLVVPMALDGVSSYLGLRPTTNTLRYLTGFLAGIAAGSILAPLVFALRKDAAPGHHILAKPSIVAKHLALTGALGTAFFFGFPLLAVVAPFVPVIAFLALAMSINLILLTLPKHLPPCHTAAHWTALLALALLLSLVEIALFGMARDLVIQTLLDGHEFSEFLR